MMLISRFKPVNSGCLLFFFWSKKGRKERRAATAPKIRRVANDCRSVRNDLKGDDEPNNVMMAAEG